MKQVTIPHVVRAAIFASLLCGAVGAQGQTAPETDGQQADGQSVPKVEIGAQYSQLWLFEHPGLTGPDVRHTRPSIAIGGRVAYNLTEHLSLEAEANFFPYKVPGENLVSGGRPFQMQFGVKAGKRFRRFGLFAKARPGLVSFGGAGRVRLGELLVGPDGTEFFDVIITAERKTHLSLDVGGVFEVYAARRVFARFDAGDTMIRYGSHLDADFTFPVAADPTFEVRPRTRHNLQFSAGVGVRLGALGGGDEDRASAAAPRARAPSTATRFEAGVQFTALSVSPIRELNDSPVLGPFRTETELGFGGRFTYNLTGYLAAEAETNLLPRNLRLARGASGRVTQGQFGVKAGKRFRSFGLFGKARPGFVSFESSLKLVGTRPTVFNGRPQIEGVFEVGRRTFFSADLGGVVEVYPSCRWLLRFDAGDTVIRYGERHRNNRFFSPRLIATPPETRHNFQFSAGASFRF
jgi:hypothetical protein